MLVFFVWCLSEAASIPQSLEKYRCALIRPEWATSRPATLKIAILFQVEVKYGWRCLNDNFVQIAQSFWLKTIWSFLCLERVCSYYYSHCSSWWYWCQVLGIAAAIVSIRLNSMVINYSFYLEKTCFHVWKWLWEECLAVPSECSLLAKWMEKAKNYLPFRHLLVFPWPGPLYKLDTTQSSIVESFYYLEIGPLQPHSKYRYCGDYQLY